MQCIFIWLDYPVSQCNIHFKFSFLVIQLQCHYHLYIFPLVIETSCLFLIWQISTSTGWCQQSDRVDVMLAITLLTMMAEFLPLSSCANAQGALEDTAVGIIFWTKVERSGGWWLMVALSWTYAFLWVLSIFGVSAVGLKNLQSLTIPQGYVCNVPLPSVPPH